MPLHYEILDAARKSYFLKLSAIKSYGYLAGGTALALQVGHRDYFDLFFLLKNKYVTLAQIIRGSQRVYQEMFSEKLFLAQLVYTQDIDPTEVKATRTLLKTPVTVREVEEFFERLVSGYAKKRLEIS